MLFLKVGAILINLQHIIDIIPTKQGMCKVFKVDGNYYDVTIGDRYTDCLDFVKNNLIELKETTNK